ncbi:conserved hypothetical protein [Nitrosomonas europaea ATCC 19718]|uniref:Winged helix-turn helix n=1 Tax=Nitrosomonas europaea (strain ATCC 19718 / CIP 103999 / KCTC 2705 / NBRC 14298) TaxID=228410 RepID=Q82UX0_NITEU|nr:conserved hypothetical protein [Nitrosomonas europaea ATCC 19718]
MSSVHHKIIKHKIGLLNLAAELGNVSRACKVMGFSRDTFYRYQAAVETGGVEALIDANRRKPNIKNRVEEATEAAILAFALEQPAFGQVRVSNELRKRGIFVSPSGVRSVWLRQNLESFKKRLSALEKHIAETGAVLTEAQVQALEKKQEDDVAQGEIETAHPGYLGSQDTFYVGTLKVWDEFTSKPSSTLIPSGQQRSCIPTKHQLHQLICSMTGYCRSLLNRVWALFAF